MFRSFLKGMVGEGMINITTWLMLDSHVYHRLNNVILPLSHGGTTQIDHIIVSIYGIFVIETKNYKGIIDGKTTDALWTQTFTHTQYQFQNPLRQNELHIKALAKLLNLDVRYFHSIIYFIGQATLNNQAHLPPYVLTKGLIRYIKSKNQRMFTPEQVQLMLENIQHRKFKNAIKAHLQHHQYVKQKHQQTTITPPLQAPNCPKCGTEMVQRTATQGNYQGQVFWGCRHYPKCKHIIRIK